MRRHAKASSVGSNQRQAQGFGAYFGGAVATSGASRGGHGTGAPSHRTRTGVLAIAATLAIVAMVGSAFASKGVVTWIGSASSGSLGAEFSTPRGVAVNSTGAGGVTAGSIYAVDSANNRIQQFSPSGEFVRAWGFDVIQSGKAGDLGNNVFEVCTVAADCKDGSGFITPAPGGAISSPRGIAVDQSTGAIYVTESEYQRVQKFSPTGAFEAAFGKDVVVDGSASDPGNVTTAQVCTVAADCKEGVPGELGGEFGGAFAFSGYPAVAPAGSPNAGNLYVADPGNQRIQEFDSTGSFVRTFGADVDGTTVGAGFEVCSVAADCKAGVEGSGNGEFASGSPTRVAVDDAGRVYAVDDNNSRVQRFTATPAFDTIYGVTELSGSPAPTDIAIDPGASSAGNAADDRVFVVKPTSFPAERRIKEFDTAADPTPPIDTHLAGSGIDSVNGLAVNTSSDRLFVSSTTGGDRIYVLDNPLSPPVVVTNSITTKTDSTATFTGTVDPQGGKVACKFQYATDSDFNNATNVTVPECETLASGGGAQPVSASITKLEPNTTYHVRLSVSRPFTPNSTVNSASQSFATDSVPPVVTGVGAVEVSNTSARLVGTVDPRKAETTYVFEYGTTPALGSSTAPLAIGSGTTPIVVSQVIGGLAKDTTYFFRLVATNPFGSSTSASETLHTRAVPLPLPANRAYEQVSPVDKHFGDAVPSTGYEATTPDVISLDGEAFAFGSVNSFGTPAGQVLKFLAHYRSRRGPGGWSTKSIVPPTCANDVTNGKLGLFIAFLGRQTVVSANVERAVIPQRESGACANQPLDPAAPLPAINLYRASFEETPESYDLLAPEKEESHPQEFGSVTGSFAAGSDDFSHVFYSSSGQQTSGTPAGDFPKLFEWVNGSLRLASVEPDGDPFLTPSTVVPSGGTAPRPEARADAVNSVSADGERFYFLNSGQVYMRESGIKTHHLSESECTSSCTAGDAAFQWASVEGDAALLTSEAKLVNADSQSGNDLYAYRHSANPVADQNLTLISKDEEPSDGSEANVLHVLGMSDDGTYVYFTASGQLVAGETKAAGEKIYRWSWNGGSPTLQYLGSASQQFQRSNITVHWERNVSEQGNALLFETQDRLLPVADQDEDFDVYVWREGHGWGCASCQVPGSPSGGESTTGRTGETFTTISFNESSMSRKLASAISEDGERVFFITQDALLPADVNGPCALIPGGYGYYPCRDVYEWHDGRVSLITPGNVSGDVGLLGIDPTGRDVFFFTRQQLVGWDNDEAIDVYDARIGGGFPEPLPQPPTCEGEGCRGAHSPAPNVTGAGTAVFQGPGNPKASRKTCPKGKRKVRRGGKQRCLKRRQKRATHNDRRAAR